MTPYEEFSTPEERLADCEAVSANLAPASRGLERAARAAVRPAPSIHYDDFPREVLKSDIAISDAARRLADALHLHLD